MSGMRCAVGVCDGFDGLFQLDTIQRHVVPATQAGDANFAARSQNTKAFFSARMAFFEL